MIAPAQRTRLAAILGLLGSDHAGEVAAAGAAATRLLRAAGLTWTDLLSPVGIQAAPSTRPTGDRSMAEATCRRYAGQLTAWECSFLDGIARRRSLTRKQAATLHNIAAELTQRNAE